MIIGNKKAVNAFDDSIRATSFKVGSFPTETASIAYDGTLLPAGTASYAGISIDATKRYLKNSGKDKAPALVESGQGKFFNGTNQYINTGIIPNQAQGTLVTRFTFSNQGSAHIVGAYDGTAVKRFGLNSEGNVEFDGIANGTNNTTFIVGKSYHLVLKWINNTAYSYVDGVLKNTFNTVNITGFTKPIFVGARNTDGTASGYFNNIIDETYYYDVALSDSQIQSLYLYPEKVVSYNGAIVPAIGNEANCKLFLPLCENSGSNVANVAVARGSELVVNSGFDTDTSWTKGTGWTISGGTANCNITTGTYAALAQNMTLVLNKLYVITYTISAYTSGSVFCQLAGGTSASGVSNSANGTYIDILVNSGSNTRVSITPSGAGNFVGSIDNVSVKEITAYPLTNYTTAMHTSAAKLSYGAQCTAWKRDSLGVLLGISNGLSFDGGVSVKQVAIGHTLAYNTQYVIEAILPYNSSATEGGLVTYPFYMRASGSSIYLRMDNYNASVAVNSGYHHAVIKYDGTTRTMNCWIDGAQRLTDVVVTKTTDYGLLSFVVGTLGISSNIKVYRLANYSKFDILKSWNKATKKINILNNISGWDVFVLAGQSNMVGISTPVDPILDATDNMIWQYGSTDKTLVIATEPLDHYGGSTANSIGLGLTFAKLYKQSVNNGRGVLLIPCAFGGTGFSNNYWTLGGVCRESMVSVSNIVMKMSNVSLKAVLWNQGEADAGLSQSAYEVHLDGFIDDMRSRILGASSVPFVLGKVHSSSSAYNAGIATATINTPTRKQLVSVVTDTDTLVLLGDNLHYDSASLRTLGQRYLTKYQEIVGA